MKKFKVATIAIIDGLVIIAAIVATFLGLIYATTISAEYLLLILAPAPAAWLHSKFNKFCDKINGGIHE